MNQSEREEGKPAGGPDYRDKSPDFLMSVFVCKMWYQSGVLFTFVSLLQGQHRRVIQQVYSILLSSE